jgi:hypothetical protein
MMIEQENKSELKSFKDLSELIEFVENLSKKRG